ncbi:MAG: periplasmic heavy metal sensor [Acidobacteria bacterium]|jgi:Spy/CpxP family protein refolding chaperone|nr:periplasmic heavy metal sensor [Acidobacteriota bacterium]
MKKSKFLYFILASLFVCLSFSNAFSQDEPPSDAPPKMNNSRRQNILQELNLSQNQIRQIRRINQENRSLLRATQDRLREASKNLDAAIYADVLNEPDIQSKMKELQMAQTEMIKIRAFKELAIRKVLEPAQLSKFREASQNFQPKMEKSGAEGLYRRLNRRNRKFNSRARP